ncbi:hypothetical protein M405DRAFT_868128 [Rhizopogon salebrosus TDB-379]|nr:hypothetical protein M405DRAFT_868128 [Rhizopogon salebrosus TDB-379]
MVRPTIHTTAEAKLQAAREKRRRYYQKCRDTILAKRRQSRKEKKSCQNVKGSNDAQSHLHEKCDEESEDEESIGTLHDCIAVVKHAKDDFMQHVKVPHKFIEGILDAYTKTMPDAPGEYGDIKILEEAISGLEDFLDRASRGQDVNQVGKSWTSKEQEKFLLEYLEKYRGCAPTKDYDEFWAEVYEEFFKRWPETKAQWPNRLDGETPLTLNEEAHLATAIQVRRVQIQNWYRWRNNAARYMRSSAQRGVLRLPEALGTAKHTRSPQRVEVFSQLHYKKDVKALANATIENENILDRGPKLKARRQLTKELFAKSDDAVKATVEAKYQEALIEHARNRHLMTKPETGDEQKTQ